MKTKNQLDADIQRVIRTMLPDDADEFECRWWMSRLAEAKRYILRKIKIANKKIHDLELELEIIEAEISQNLINSQHYTATDRKKIAENQYILDPRYKDSWEKIYAYQSVIEGYRADLENLTDKSFAIRKIADFEKTHLMYEDD